MVNYVNKVKVLVDHLPCLEVSLEDKDMVIILLENLSASYNTYLVTALEVMPMKEPTMIHVMVRLMYETSKCKKKEPNVKMVSWCYNKVDNSFPRQGASSCFYCGKPSHIACFCYKPKNKERKNVKNAKDDDDYVFVLHNGVQSKSTCK